MLAFLKRLRPGPLDLRQWRACPYADAPWPHRSISALGLSCCSGEWKASLSRREQYDLKLVETKTFSSGVVLLAYEPAQRA